MTSNINPMQLLEKAVEGGFDSDRLLTLIKLHESEQAETKRLLFLADFAAFKAENVVIEKDVTRKSFDEFGQEIEYKHSSLGNMIETLNPVLAKHNLSFYHTIEQTSAAMKVTCHLLHVHGHVQTSHMWGPADTTGAKNQLQGIGSTRTYLERYTLEAVTGTSSSTQDDDGHMAPRGEIIIDEEADSATEKPTVKIVGKAVGDALRIKAQKAEINMDKILNWLKTELNVNKWSQIPEAQLENVSAMIEQMAAEQSEETVSLDDDALFEESEEEIEF